MIRTGCPSHNCGGRCLLKVFVRDGRIVRIETDDRPGDTLADPQLRACIRGRAYRKRQYHPDRLMHPLKRVGKRGEGKFERISWDEALDRIASEFARIKTAYGNEAFYVPYGTGSYNQINGRQTAQRLMNLYGGSLGFYNSYSWAAISAATPTVYGTSVTGNQRQDWLNAKYILMWSWNPAEMRDGTNSEYFVRKAREKGARVVCVDPRMTLSAVALADEWIPIRPGHGRGHDVGHGPRHGRREPLRRGVRPDPLRRLRRDADARRRRRRRELQGLPPRHARRRRQDARLGRAHLRRPARDDRPHRPRIRHDQARRPLPGLRHAAPRLRRAGRPGRMRAGGDHRQRRRPRRLGQRHRPPGPRRRPLLARLPGRRQSRRRP